MQGNQRTDTAILFGREEERKKHKWRNKRLEGETTGVKWRRSHRDRSTKYTVTCHVNHSLFQICLSSLHTLHYFSTRRTSRRRTTIQHTEPHEKRVLPLNRSNWAVARSAKSHFDTSFFLPTFLVHPTQEQLSAFSAAGLHDEALRLPLPSFNHSLPDKPPSS